MKKINILGLLVILILTSVSCNRPTCNNKNPIFDKYEIKSKAYKIELIQQIEAIGQQNLRYWFESYLIENEKEYIRVNIQNDSLCAKGQILVNDWHKIEGIKRTKGKGYSGAELIGLTFKIEKDSNTIDIVYKDLIKIID
jgi:hypothetical protein